MPGGPACGSAPRTAATRIVGAHWVVACVLCGASFKFQLRSALDAPLPNVHLPNHGSVWCSLQQGLVVENTLPAVQARDSLARGIWW